MNPQLTESMKSYLRTQAKEGFTALSFAFRRHGELVAAGAIGHTDGTLSRPAQTGDLYNIGSISKVYCTAAVMQLAERGLVDLDAPVCQYLPRFTMADPRYRDITVRMCLCHTSGLPGTHWNASFASTWTGDQYYEMQYDYFAHSRLKADPGQYAVYCNDGFTLAEMVVAQVSGQSFDDYLQDHITGPIGAWSTCCSRRLAAGHDHVAQRGQPVEYLAVMGAGGVNTDMIDLTLFGDLFLRDNPVLSKASREEMARSHGRTDLKKDTCTEGLGLGWDCVRWGHPGYDFGPGVLLKGGGTLQFLSLLVVMPKYDLSCAISATTDVAANNFDLVSELAAMVLDSQGIEVRVDKPAAPQAFEAVPQDVAQAFTGLYGMPTTLLDVSFSGDTLYINKLLGANKAPMFPPMRHAGGRFHSPQGTAEFEVGPDGTHYLLLTRDGRGAAPFGQRLTPQPALSDAWKKRLGKQYVAVDVNANDLCAYGMTLAFCLQESPVPGLMMAHFSTLPGTADVSDQLFAAQDDQTGRMVLQSPMAGSRDQFAPEFRQEDGAELVYNLGFRYIDAASLPQAAPGQVVIGADGRNALFRVPDTACLHLYIPADGRALLLGEHLEHLYDSRAGGVIPPAKNAILSLLAPAGSVFRLG